MGLQEAHDLLSTILFVYNHWFLFYFSPCSMGGFDRRLETQSGDEASTLERRTVLLAQWIIL